MLKGSRRSFVKRAAWGAAGFMIVPRRLIAQSGQTPPSETIRLAAVGCGNMAWGDIQGLAGDGSPFVALCDVDERQAAAARKRFPDAPFFRDFRVMLDRLDKEIDAVLVATPDHTHAVAAMAAITRGKHVYCEKPLAHTVGEVRALMRAARRHKVITQLGNQEHASETIRVFKEWVQAGVLGNIREIHAWAPAVYSRVDDLDSLNVPHDIPKELDWELWQGAVLPRMPYNPAFLPRAWRHWAPYGTSTIGDWMCHVLDPSFWALDLGAPAAVTAEEVNDWDPVKHALTFPKGDIIRFDFPAAGGRGPVTLRWFDGLCAAKVPRPEGLEPDRPLAAHGADKQSRSPGAVVYGDKGVLIHGSHGAGGLRVVPEAKMRELKESGALPDKSLPRVKGGHRKEWLQCIRDNTPAGSDFAAYGGPLSEIALLGIAALQEPGKTLRWDADACAFTNSKAANAKLNRAYQPGWSPRALSLIHI